MGARVMECDFDLVNKRPRARLIAFYLPQFHPIPENDTWWGKGFTEWTNVAKAVPLFKGHYQPNLPGHLGFYDLRVPEVREAQAELARGHGIEAFCYWHYWFGNGVRLLERPFNEVLKTGEPQFSFCLGWANMTWSGVWHGCPDRVLMEQTYPGKEDEEAHFYSLLEAFFDPRYLKVGGLPLFVLYAPHNLPESSRFTDHWREMAIKSGLNGIYFVGIMNNKAWRPEMFGLDAVMLHAPGIFFPKLKQVHVNSNRRILGSLSHLFSETGASNKKPGPIVCEYEDYVRSALPELPTEYVQYPCVVPNWDNTPRSSRLGYVLRNSTPDLYGTHLARAVEQVVDRELERRLVFVKSWNEWAEGNYLEPDRRFGMAWLEVNLKVLCGEEIKAGSMTAR